MKTPMKNIQILEYSKKSVQTICEELKSENPIIIPTDTNYNLACLPESEQAIGLIFKYKERAKDKPLSLFFLNPNDWGKYGYTKNKELMNQLVKTFWPGALNIVVENKTNYNYILNNSKTISLGCIKNPVWRGFMRQLNSPIAITSANISGTADNLLITEEIAVSQMGTKVNFMLRNTSDLTTTKSSTIISLAEENKIKLIREGDITKEQINLAIIELGYTIE